MNADPVGVDPAVLARLRAELDDDEGWFLFVRNFLNHLPRRMDKLRRGLAGADYEVAMDAVLSLKISCQMVGAERLAGMALQLQQSLTVGPDGALCDMPGLERVLGEISVLAGQTASVLEARAAQKF
ncbi:Hpt domain-containing protein [Pseudarthrobacter enclensis]|uniref:Hpt domain-containing protein n=1 Tax=Pseudarthrobacter enclensis TaxID=993070 RepID=UPI0034372E40